MITCTRRLTFSAGHRVYGHESKCAHPHGHNYVVEITCEGMLDPLGRVVDFGVIKKYVGAFLDEHWDHAFIYFIDDPEMHALFDAHPEWRSFGMLNNPTAENMALDVLEIAVACLSPFGIRVRQVRIHETENCYADAFPH